MAVDPKRRQKKLAKKKAKRKSVVSSKGSAHLKGKAGPILMAQRSPVHECFIGSTVYEEGFGTVVISRKMPDNEIAMGLFLVDTYCIGVKDCYFITMSKDEYSYRMNDLDDMEGLENTNPSCCRKLVEQAVEYAKSLGLKPHKDYAVIKKMFGGIDADECQREFEFGRDGIPVYIAGPNANPLKVKQTIKTLMKKCGPDNFEFIGPAAFDDLSDL